MTATEELRRLLDERGVEWWPMHDIESGYREDRDTEFLIYGCKHVAHEWGCRLQVDMLTPEQAIAATLGNEPDDAAMVKLHDRMNVALHKYERARGINRRDGDGEVVVPLVAELHSLIEEAATLGRGTCRVESMHGYTDPFVSTRYSVELSCHTLEDWPDREPPDFCPWCGAKVVKE